MVTVHRFKKPGWRSVFGLGLSIVKRVIDASGGSVAIDSHLGQGTTVRVSLVVADAATAKPAAAT